MNRSALFSTSLLLSAAMAQAQPLYEFTALGDLDGRGFQSEAWGINDLGQVVGFSASSLGTREAFLWDEVNGMQALGDLPGGPAFSHAFGINNQGQVVGLSSTGNLRPFIWDPVNGMQDMGDLPGGRNFGRSLAINDAGQATGWSGTGAGERAFRWDAANGMENLGDLPGGNNFSRGSDINEAGDVVGFSVSGNGTRAFIWDDANGMRELDDLPDGFDFNIANAINDNGQVVGNLNIIGSIESRAFLWDEVNGFLDLGDLPGGLDLSQGFDINDGGTVVGFSRSQLGNRAFVWDEVDGMQDLNDLIDPSLGWNLEEALAINNLGQIVGFGRNADGDDEAFLLTPLLNEFVWDGSIGDPRWNIVTVAIDGSRDTNWQGGDGAQLPGPSDAVVFNDVADASQRTIDLNGDQSAFSVLFDSAVLADGQSSLNYTLDSTPGQNTLTLATGGLTVADGNVLINSNVTLGSAGTWDIASGSTVEMAGTLEGSLGLTKTGDGTLVFMGAQVDMGAFTVSGGTVNIDSGLVTVARTTLIDPGSVVNLNGGRFEFGAMSFESFANINGVAGSLAGFVDGVVLTGFTDVATVNPTVPVDNIAPEVDASEVVITGVTNRGFLFGPGSLMFDLVNDTSGEIEVITGERMLINGAVTNLGTVTLAGGQFHTTQAFINRAGGRVIGVGGLQADGGTVNDGTMQFSDTTNVTGDLTNNASGLILSAGRTTIFFDDVVNHGEVRTFENSFTVFYGEVSGSGSYTGTGTVTFAGSFSPGNSPGVVDFGGDLTFDPTHRLNIELDGTAIGEFDRLQVAGDMLLDGFLDVSLLVPFELSPGQAFEIIDVEGMLSGRFVGLDQGALIGTFDGVDLVIDYFGGDGNDVVITAIPEPASIALLGLGGLLMCRRRRG